MERMSVFYKADNEQGYIQAVIMQSEFPFFERLGFFKTADEAIESEPKKTSDNKPLKNGKAP